MAEATTVRVDSKVKAELDRLQGLVQSETGNRLTQSELLARLVRFARSRPGAFLRESSDWTPPTRKEMDRLFSRVQSWGVKTDVSKIDDELYGNRT